MKIHNLVEKQFIKNLNIDVNKDYKLFHENGKNLLVSSRIDIIPKLCFLEAYKEKYKTDFYENLYKASIEIFSNGNFTEPGNEVKTSFEKYKEIFIKLNSDIEKKGFDEKKSIFIKGSNNAVLDGGHRAAIAYYHNLKIPYVIIDNKKVDYDLQYFEDRYMSRKYLDYICLDYVKRKTNIFAICLWQSLNNKQKKLAYDFINNKVNIIYKKDIVFNYNGFKNFMIEIYGHQNWLGTPSNHFQGIYKKVDNCFKKGNYMTCVVVEASSVEEVLAIKKNLREKFKLGNHSIHSTDNMSETIDMLSLLLNDNTINVLNKANFDKYISFYDDINLLKQEKNMCSDKSVIYGDVVLKICGLKNSNRFEIISIDGTSKNDDLVLNPDNFFYLHGLKFVYLNKYKELSNVSEEDLKNVSKFMKGKKVDLSEYVLKIKRYYRKVRWLGVKFLIKIKLYNFVKGIYNRVKKIDN